MYILNPFSSIARKLTFLLICYTTTGYSVHFEIKLIFHGYFSKVFIVGFVMKLIPRNYKPEIIIYI